MSALLTYFNRLIPTVTLVCYHLCNLNKSARSGFVPLERRSEEPRCAQPLRRERRRSGFREPAPRHASCPPDEQDGSATTFSASRSPISESA
jgi:hypothetical protein